jgi:long-subunit fatty acid transport protein
MSQLSRGIFSALAVSLAFGAVAWGRDLAGVAQGASASSQDPAAAIVNRTAKADRAAAVARSAAPTRTIALRLQSLSDTSVLVRIPLAIEAGTVPPPRLLSKPDDQKPLAACEPVVSVLTEIAGRLGPGRCIT